MGYPDRLAGTEIPLPARIVSVCDAFDAMTSDRPYRKGTDVLSAIAELRLHAGTQFDPAVIDVFCDIASVQVPSSQHRISPTEQEVPA
jgi:HD-GYP domain-containing protein (c-di-GMP phosphodiesterase class II)